MKRISVIVFFCILSLCSLHSVESPVLLSSVLSEAVTSVTKLYEMYDQTMNQIEMIKQQYEQMQWYIDRAANWKWNEIQWDGNLDFRNEIMQATTQIDKQLTNIRKIKDSMKANTVSFGGKSFSIASLAGIKIAGQGDIHDFVNEGSAYYKDGFREACDVWAEGVTDEEAQFIWAKYGLTPANYKMVRSVEERLADVTLELIGNVEESPEKKAVEEERGAILEKIMDMLSQEGITSDQIAGINAMLQEQTIFSLQDLEKKINTAAGYIAWNNQLQVQKQEAEIQSRMELHYEITKNSISDNF